MGGRELARAHAMRAMCGARPHCGPCLATYLGLGPSEWRVSSRSARVRVRRSWLCSLLGEASSDRTGPGSDGVRARRARYARTRPRCDLRLGPHLGARRFGALSALGCAGACVSALAVLVAGQGRWGQPLALDN